MTGISEKAVSALWAASSTVVMVVRVQEIRTLQTPTSAHCLASHIMIRRNIGQLAAPGRAEN